MDYNIFWLIAVALFALVLSTPGTKHSSGLRRLGRNPGLFNLKIWLARIQFLWSGPQLVDQNYLKVCQGTCLAYKDLRKLFILGERCQLCHSDFAG